MCSPGQHQPPHQWTSGTSAMLGSVRLWVVRLVLLATTGPPPWLSLGSMFAQPVRSEPASDHSLLCQCLHTNTQSPEDCHEAAEICSLKPSHRLQRLLWNPLSKFSSPCWTREASCLPPVLSQTQINRIESDSRSDCMCTVEQVLKKLVGTNEEMEKSLEVLLSVHMMVDCSNHSHCQRCKVSPTYLSVSPVTSARLRPGHSRI